MPATILLSELPRHHRARIARVHGGDGSAERRLLDIGLDEGLIVEFLQAGPFGDPLAVQVGEHLVALRRADAMLVEVEPLGETRRGEPS